MGGPVVGELLAKAGFSTHILKFWKLGVPALSGDWVAIKRFFGFGTRQA